MDFYRKNWYYIGGLIFVVLAFVMVLFGDMVSPLRRLNIALFMGLIIHEFEEYVLPGGFPVALNKGVFGEPRLFDRYPANTNSVLIVNVFCAYPIFILGIIFCNFIPLGIFLSYFGFAQILIHGVVINKKFRTIYNPGMASIIFVLIPLGVYYLWYVATHFPLPLWYWWAPLLVLPVYCILTIMLPIQLGKDKDTSYIFPAKEIKPFSVSGKAACNRR